jgi:hypothetical protein
MNFQEFKKRALQDESFRKEYYRFDLLFELKELPLKWRLFKARVKEYFKPTEL